MATLCKIEDGIVVNRAHFDGAVPDAWAPEGETWVENDDAQIGWSYADGVFSEPTPLPPSAADVNAERDRRTLPGRITVTSAALEAAVPVDMRIPADRDNLVLLSDIAKNKSVLGDGSPIAFRDAENVIHSLTVAQILVLATACAAYGSAVYAASWALKDNPPIPSDFADDSHWPSTEVSL